MEFADIVRNRYAAKSFSRKKVSESFIDELLDLVRLSPSSFNLQPWKVIVVRDAAVKRRLRPKAFMQKQITSCSHLLVLCADLRFDEHVARLDALMKDGGISLVKRKAFVASVKVSLAKKSREERVHYAELQVYLALGNALNGAASLGLDACPMGGFSQTGFAEVLGLPAWLKPVVLCPVGYADDSLREKLRFPDVVFRPGE